MAEVTPKDILLDIGCTRHGVIFVAGARRAVGSLAPPYTHARADATPCATHIDRGGVLRRAAADKLRVEYADLNADGIRETPRVPLEGSRVNLITWSDALSNWASVGTPVVTDAHATLGDLALTLVEDNDAGVVEAKSLPVSFTGDGVKGIVFCVEAPATPADANNSRYRLRDNTVPADRLLVTFSWNSDGTLASATGVTGTVSKTEQLGRSSTGRLVYRVHCQTTAITAANDNNSQAFPTDPVTASQVGKIIIGGVQAENATFPSSRIKTAGSSITRADESLSHAMNFGTPAIGEERTTYVWFDPQWPLTGSDGTAPGVFTFGGTGGFAVDGKVCWDAHRSTGAAELVVRLNANEAATSSAVVLTLPGSGPLKLLTQLRASGSDHVLFAELGANSGTGPARTIHNLAWREQKAMPGSRGSGVERGFLGLYRLTHLRGRFTIAEIEAALPGLAA